MFTTEKTCLYHGDAVDFVNGYCGPKFQSVITSPPYWRHRASSDDPYAIGAEPEAGLYVQRIVELFSCFREVMRPDATLWLNLGDTYFRRQLSGIPWRVALALQDDGWFLRSEVIWHKPNPLPQNVTDRLTVAHEQVFLFAANQSYRFNQLIEPATYAGVSRGGSSLRHGGNDGADNKKYDTRNKRDVWKIAPERRWAGVHSSAFPELLVEPMVLASTNEGDTVFDPFIGSGTTAVVAVKHWRNAAGCDLDRASLQLAHVRIENKLNEVSKNGRRKNRRRDNVG